MKKACHFWLSDILCLFLISYTNKKLLAYKTSAMPKLKVVKIYHFLRKEGYKSMQEVGGLGDL